MATEAGATTTTETKTTEPAAQQPPKEEKPQATQQAATKTAEEKAPAAQEPRTPKVIDDGDEPDEKELYQLSGAALKKRLGRYAKSQLKEHFGTSDPDEIKKKLDKLTKLEAKAEEERLAKLSEDEKNKELLAKERQRAEAAERRAQEAEDRQVVATQDRRVTNFASKFIDEDLVEDATERFAKFVMKLSPKQVAKLDDGDIQAWFENLAKEKPKFAKGAPAAAARTEEKKPAERKSITNGNERRSPEGRRVGSGGEEFDPARVNPKHPQAYTRQQLKNFGYP